MTEQANKTTETGVVIDQYIAERTAGTVKLTKPIKSSSNYFYVRASWTVQPGPDGKPLVVEGAPTMNNINRGSVAEMEARLVADEARIADLRAQLQAITDDMDALDAAP